VIASGSGSGSENLCVVDDGGGSDDDDVDEALLRGTCVYSLLAQSAIYTAGEAASDWYWTGRRMVQAVVVVVGNLDCRWLVADTWSLVAGPRVAVVSRMALVLEVSAHIAGVVVVFAGMEMMRIEEDEKKLDMEGLEKALDLAAAGSFGNSLVLPW
jgi:hypothetical protein